MKQITLLLLLFCLCTRVEAQNNAFKIHDDLFEKYQEMMKVRNDTSCFEIGNTMRKMAIRLGDKKGECLSYAGGAAFFSQTRHITPAAHEFFEEMRAVARKNDLLQYRFLAWNDEAVMYINNGMTSEAIHYYTEGLKEAKATNNTYGLYSAFNGLGNLYFEKLLLSSAKEQYEKAIEVLKADSIQSPAQAYSQLANIHILWGDYDKALEYTNIARKESKNKSMLLKSCMAELESYYFLHRREDFMKTWKEYESLLESQGTSSRNFPNYLKGLKLLYENNIQGLHDLIKANPTINNLDILRREMAVKENRIEDALKIEESRVQTFLRKHEAGSLTEMADYNVRLEQSEVERENAQLELEKEKAMQKNRNVVTGIVIGFLLIMSILLWLLLRSRSMRLRTVEKARQKAEAAKKKAEEAQIEADNARKEAEEANKMKTMFIQNMSHEVRTPLNAICGFSQLLADPDMSQILTDEDRQEYNKIIANSTNILTTLVNDILDMGDLESGKYHICKENMPVNEICHHALKMIELRMPPGVALNFHTDLQDDYMIYSDPNRVQQIVKNFLTNAIKYTEKGSITLSVSNKKVAGKLSFAVTDTGTGVPADKAEAIFERFEKLDPNKQGTGLGLPICRSLAKCLGGDVYLDTKYPGPGARFVFLLTPEKKEEIPS